mgnify:CR=1 FL=1
MLGLQICIVNNYMLAFLQCLPDDLVANLQHKGLVALAAYGADPPL